jgi:hypothetical protein
MAALSVTTVSNRSLANTPNSVTTDLIASAASGG